MSIKNRIFVTYLVLIAIIGLYIALTGFTRLMRLRVEADREAVLELRTNWGATRVLLGDMVINWDGGSVYREFRSRRALLGTQLDAARGSVATRWYYPADLKQLFDGLAAVWEVADAHLDRVVAVVENPEFVVIERMVQRQPGLQRLNHLWVELMNRNTPESRALAHRIQQLIAEIEFFPIYGDTVERLFVVLVTRADTMQRSIARSESLIRFVFFLTFLSACLWLASRFAHSLSRPIIEVSHRLYDFAGLAGAASPFVEAPADELRLLATTVDRMIDHYTELSQRAGQLARGDVSSDAVHFPREGIVGRSLDEIAQYLHELARTSAWIRDGKYGLQIRPRSEEDVITRNFNIMSAVIQEKITTLRSMFEAVDEAVCVIDDHQNVVEANSQLYRLIGARDAGWEAAEFVQRQIVPSLVSATCAIGVPGTPDGPLSNVYTNVNTLQGHEVPVKMNVRQLTGARPTDTRRMFILTNESWRARAKREQERLRAQAVVAELRALRAQINPHFFFNTLNTIAHLIETDSESAVGTVQDLADLFRYTLAATKRDRVPLEDELNHIRRYLAIEHLRQGEGLRVHYDVDPTLHHEAIPPMLLQPLVENAVRYGGNAFGEVDVTITGRYEDQVMVVQVADRGSGPLDIESLLRGDGTGLKNVNQRFRTIFGQPLHFAPNEPHGLVVTLRMPRSVS